MSNKINLKCEHNHHIFHPLCEQLSFSGQCLHVAGVVALAVLGIFTLGIGPLVIYGVYKAFSKKSTESTKPTEILGRVDLNQVQDKTNQAIVEPVSSKGLSIHFVHPDQKNRAAMEKAIEEAKLSPAHYFVRYFSSARTSDEQTLKDFTEFCNKHANDGIPVCFVAVSIADQVDHLQDLKESARKSYLNTNFPNCLSDPLIVGTYKGNYKVRDDINSNYPKSGS